MSKKSAELRQKDFAHKGDIMREEGFEPIIREKSDQNNNVQNVLDVDLYQKKTYDFQVSESNHKHAKSYSVSACNAPAYAKKTTNKAKIKL